MSAMVMQLYDYIYVECSKGGNGNIFFILTPNGETKNVVYPIAAAIMI